jgi:CRISPR-associated protein Cas5t
MIALRLTVPIASWRKGHAREFLESEDLPPPATCYGALLSLVGESDRTRHVGVRVTAGLLTTPAKSRVVRTAWKIKDRNKPQGTADNVKPEFQELLTGADLVIWCDSSDEEGARPSLEERVRDAVGRLATVERFGGWCLGESTHLVNDMWLLPAGPLPAPCRAFLLQEDGLLTLPVWVDHVGTKGTRYAVGALQVVADGPQRDRIPVINA